MKNFLIFAIGSLLMTGCTETESAESNISEASVTLETKLDSVCYGLGVDIADNLKGQGLGDLNVEAMAKGFRDILNDSELAISKEEVGPLLNEYMGQMQAEKAKEAAKEGEEFLAINATKKGVITLESGMQYEVLSSGSGATPGLNDKVTTHYTGTLIDGTVFDSSVERGQPASFPVSGVIKGWTEALQLMKEGDKWKLYIPYDLAYGDKGAGANIGPYSALIFEIELISVDK
jgi:FKBP-type peptidyl-prolyl cis-trans isomerase FklB